MTSINGRRVLRRNFRFQRGTTESIALARRLGVSRIREIPAPTRGTWRTKDGEQKNDTGK